MSTMKKRRRTCLKSSQQQMTSSTTRMMMTTTTTTNYYLPDECWESIFTFLIHDFKSLSVVSQQFLSITNRQRFSLTIGYTMGALHSRLFKRFTNLTSLDISSYRGNLNKLLIQISCFPLNLTYLNISDQTHFPTDGLEVFSRKITTLTSLICSHIVLIDSPHLFLIADIFPLLQELDLSYSNELRNIHSLNHCDDTFEEGIAQILRRCCDIKCLNLTGRSRPKLYGINFEVSKLEVLNLTSSSIDDETLYVISKSCRGLLNLLLEDCDYITEKGVKHVIKSCTQLREINLRGCLKVHGYIVSFMVFSRPSLRMILAPPRYCFNRKEMKYLSLGGCGIY